MAAVEDKPYTGVLTVVSAVTIIIAVITATGVDALYLWGADKEFERKVEDRPVPELEALRASSHERLSTYGWVDRANGVVHVPIEEAKKQLLEELR
jgi:hypothetical protein